MFLIGAIALAVASVRYQQVVTVTVRGRVKTIVTGPQAPSVGLISASLGAGFVLLLVAAFFNRVAEVNSPFGSVKLLDASKLQQWRVEQSNWSGAIRRRSRR